MTNPNARILLVPKEFGATEDDQYYGSIGDATHRHVSKLSGSDRLLWETVIVTRDGNIFQTIPSTEHNNTDTLSLRGRDLDKLAKKFNLDIEWIKEEFAEEAKRQENSEDALDRGELIPFEDHEKFPGMTKYLDLPTTPRDRFLYLGNCSRDFYDEYPEGHPDSRSIDLILAMLNRDIDEIDEKYGNWVKHKISGLSVRQYVRNTLYALVDKLVGDGEDPDSIKAQALTEIDKAWRNEYRNAVANKLYNDAVFVLLLHKEKEWNQAAKHGENVFKQVKMFGRLLHSEFRDQMRRHHWTRYYTIKKKFAPKVLFKGKDINRVPVRDIKELFNLNQSAAEEIWHHIRNTDKDKGPFSTLAEVYNKGYITRKSFSNSENMEKATIFVEEQMQKAIDNQDRKIVSETAAAIVRSQKSQPDKLSRDEWKTLWVYYRLCRDEFNNLMRGKNV